MSQFIRTVRTSQPQGVVGPNPAHPLFSKLRFLSPLGNNTSNAVNGRINSEFATTKLPFKGGIATKFNGASAYIQLPTNDLCNGYPITVSCWVNLQAPAGVMWSLNGSNYNTLLGANSGNLLNSVSQAGSVGVAAANVPTGLTHITHVARNGSYAIYMNSVLMAQETVNANFSNPAAGNHSIGNRLNGSTPQYFNNSISDFAVFQGELTQAEITALYQNTQALYIPTNRSLWLPGTVAAGGDAAASGGITAIAITSPTSSASGTATVSGQLATVTTLAPTATASGSTVVDASASAATSVISLSVPAGSASGTATASGALASMLMSAATAQAAGSAQASGALAALQIIVPSGSASAGGAGVAAGALAQVNLSAALAAAYGYGIATVGIASLSATAPTALASSGTSASASGLMSFVGLAPTSASAEGSASAAGVMSYLGLIAPTGTATGAGFAVYPTAPQVLSGITYGPTGADYTGTLTSGIFPSAADIAAAVWAHTQ